MVPHQLGADHVRLAGDGHAEIMGELELPGMVPLLPDQFLHDLKENPRRIESEETVSDVHHFFMQCVQRTEAVIGLSDLQGMEEVDHGVGDAKPLGSGHLLDPMGIQIGVEQIIEAFPGGFPAQDILHHPEKIQIFSIKHEFLEYS
jgi:hypothetical protein